MHKDPITSIGRRVSNLSGTCLHPQLGRWEICIQTACLKPFRGARKQKIKRPDTTSFTLRCLARLVLLSSLCDTRCGAQPQFQTRGDARLPALPFCPSFFLWLSPNTSTCGTNRYRLFFLDQLIWLLAPMKDRNIWGITVDVYWPAGDTAASLFRLHQYWSSTSEGEICCSCYC